MGEVRGVAVGGGGGGREIVGSISGRIMLTKPDALI